VRIDAHQHFWSRARGNDYGFLTPDAGILYNDYLPNQLEPLLGKQRIDYAVTVQAAPTIEETEWLLAQTSDVDFIIGVVGWLDFDVPADDFARAVDSLCRHPKFVGLRPMLQDLEDDRWILRPQVIANLRHLAALDLPFDILVYPRHLPHILQMLEQVDGLRAVVDHCAKPVIRRGILEPWAELMQKISHFPAVRCKVSGLVTEANLEHWKVSDFAPFVSHVIACFGADRLLFGSDWPVCLQAASYDEVVALVERLVPDTWGEQEMEKLFGLNAMEFYKLNPGRETD
jgi:L-fuconolactonase